MRLHIRSNHRFSSGCTRRGVYSLTRRLPGGCFCSSSRWLFPTSRGKTAGPTSCSSCGRDRLQVLLEITNALVSELDIHDLFPIITACLRGAVPHEYSSCSPSCCGPCRSTNSSGRGNPHHPGRRPPAGRDQSRSGANDRRTPVPDRSPLSVEHEEAGNFALMALMAVKRQTDTDSWSKNCRKRSSCSDMRASSQAVAAASSSLPIFSRGGNP